MLQPLELPQLQVRAARGCECGEECGMCMRAGGRATKMGLGRGSHTAPACTLPPLHEALVVSIRTSDICERFVIVMPCARFP